MTDYPRLDRFAAPARAKAEVWRIVASVLLIALFFLAAIAVVMVLVVVIHGQLIGAALLLSVTRGVTPGGLVLLLASFGFLLLGVFLAVRAVHRRSAATLFGAGPRKLWRTALAVGLPVLAINLALVPLMFATEELRANTALANFAVAFPFALAALAVQIGAEETIFRGYLLQQMAARFRSPFAWMAVPSVLFALMHYQPTFGGTYLAGVMVWAFGFGLVAADLTARTGNIGAALGLHFANNFAAFFTVGVEHSLDGMALWTTTLDFADAGALTAVFAVAFLQLLVYWLTARLVLRV